MTGSCHELTIDHKQGLLIDCGLFQGAETSAGKAGASQLSIEFPVEHIVALVVTHVHIDHVGRIPWLMAAGFEGPIYCSEPSAKLLPLVLEDAIKMGITRDRQMVERVLKKITSRIVPLNYSRWHSVENSSAHPLSIKLKPAGHILGSAYVEIRAGKGEAQRKVVFSGDLGAPFSPLLSAPRSPYSADIVVIESTYGDREHSGRKERRQQLKTALEKALQDKGVVLIPAFSIGRTQAILYELESLIHQNKERWVRKGLPWEDLEIILDSPLAIRLTQTYRQLSEHWDKEAQRRLRQQRKPLGFEQLTLIESHKDHQAAVSYLKKTARPSVVIAASGMCAGGRITNYLKALISDPRTDIVFIGYQANGTPGRDIQKYGPRKGFVELDGDRYEIKAGIHTLSGYSAHADQIDLINFIKRMRKPPQEVRLIHGDDEAKQTLRGKLQQLLPEAKVWIP